jgi:hypothetical protein
MKERKTLTRAQPPPLPKKNLTLRSRYLAGFGLLALLVAAGIVWILRRERLPPGDPSSPPVQLTENLPHREFPDTLEGTFAKVSYELYGSYYQESSVESSPGEMRATIVLSGLTEADFRDAQTRALVLAQACDELEKDGPKIFLAIRIDGPASDGLGNYPVQPWVSISRVQGLTGKINWENADEIKFSKVFKLDDIHNDYLVSWSMASLRRK